MQIPGNNFQNPPPQISFKIHDIISSSFHLIILRGVPEVLSQPSPPLFKRPENELLLRLGGTDDPNCNSSLQNRNHWFSPLVLYRCLAPLVLHMPVSRWDKCGFFTWDEASKASSYPSVAINASIKNYFEIIVWHLTPRRIIIFMGSDPRKEISSPKIIFAWFDLCRKYMVLA